MTVTLTLLLTCIELQMSVSRLGLTNADTAEHGGCTAGLIFLSLCPLCVLRRLGGEPYLDYTQLQRAIFL